MLPSDAIIADLLVRLYDHPDAPLETAGFDIYESGETDGGICWASKRIDDVDAICLRGSITLIDWIRDALAFPIPFSNKGLGPVHAGFKIGMDDCWDEIRRRTKGPWVVSGHSLGAGRAAILTGLMVLDGCSPLRRVAFGEPRPGFHRLADLIAPIPAASYCNGSQAHDHDKVTDVPYEIGPIGYIHPCALTYVDAPPSAEILQRDGIWARHHMPLYRQAVSVSSVK
jgi:hypothetical protein